MQQKLSDKLIQKVSLDSYIDMKTTHRGNNRRFIMKLGSVINI